MLPAPALSRRVPRRACRCRPSLGAASGAELTNLIGRGGHDVVIGVHLKVQETAVHRLEKPSVTPGTCFSPCCCLACGLRWGCGLTGLLMSDSKMTEVDQLLEPAKVVTGFYATKSQDDSVLNNA
jgi:hypothetical protein